MKNHTSGIIVITGAAGFIGSAVVRYLNDLGYHNLLLVDDIKKTEKWKNLLGKKFFDFISKHQLFSWLAEHYKDVSSIIHLGACSNTLEKDGDYLMENNYRYTQKLATITLQKGLRFIYASSAATYGDGSLGFVDDLDRLEELRPLNLYGLSKHLFDLWAKQEGILDKIVGLKYFNVFGPNENHKINMASMVYKMYPKVKDEGLVRLFKSSDPKRFPHGQQCRDFIYIKDAVKMTVDFLFNNICGIFNLGMGKTVTWNALATALFKAVDLPVNIEYIEMPVELRQQYQNYTCADMTKYFQAHGYNNVTLPYKYKIEDAVSDYVQEYLLRDKQW